MHVVPCDSTQVVKQLALRIKAVSLFLHNKWFKCLVFDSERKPAAVMSTEINQPTF